VRSLDGQSVIITGCSSGLGLGAAKHFLDRGARVTICSRQEDRIRELAGELGDGCCGVRADVTVAADREQLIEAALRHGGGLDVLINNAGNMYRGPVEQLQEDKLLEIFHGNVVSGMMLTGQAVPHMVARGGGAVIFVGSIHTRRAFPGASPYAATKAALQGLTRVLAAELGPKNIRVNCVLPGAVFTRINQRAGLFDDEEALTRLEGMSGLHALGRIGTAEEIAEAMEYLVCAEWTTGALLDVDGGLGLGVTQG
jgi:3-oxoacyl-[acyl-carrier protein] reductase